MFSLIKSLAGHWGNAVGKSWSHPDLPSLLVENGKRKSGMQICLELVKQLVVVVPPIAKIIVLLRIARRELRRHHSCVKSEWEVVIPIYAKMK
jgi:hypothetical protein